MSVRPARRPRPATVAFVAGVLLACAYFMWAPGHPTTMAMTDAMVTSVPVTAEHPAASSPANEDCPAMSMQCPLASAHSPMPLAVAGPGTAVVLEPGGAGGQPPATAAPSRAWPRAPDPVCLLCVSRT